ncbi:MAG: CoA transferase subunit A [Chloroflexi bacterium]|nr:CoA transferase subunit A [Chloroflexota bacterium]
MAETKVHKFMTRLEDQRPASMERTSKLISIEEAGKILATKKRFGISGTHSSEAAMTLIRAAIRAGAKDITLVPPTTCSIAADLWIAAKRLKKLYLSYVGFEFLGFAPAFRKAAQEQSIDIVEADEPFIQLGTQAAAGGRPFNAVRRLYDGTIHPKVNPELKKIIDPYTGEEVYLIPPLKTDVYIMHAQASDIYGNAQSWGGNQQEPDKAKASDMVIVEADEIVGSDVIRQDPSKSTIRGEWTDYVVHTPFGAHPTFSPGQYAADEAHLRLYGEMCRDGRAEEYLEKFVFGPKDHFDYLERVGGLKKMVELKRMLSL